MRPGLNIAPAYHPSDDALAVTLSVRGNSDLYLLDARGEILKRLTDSWAIDVSPAWSPEGSAFSMLGSITAPLIYL